MTCQPPLPSPPPITLLLVHAAAWLVFQVGCAQDQQAALQSDAVLVASLVGDVQDAARTPERFQSLFTDAARPDGARRQQYGRYSYRALERPTIRGDTAVVKVLVRDRMDNEVGQVEWRAVRQDGAWRLDVADLPPAVP